MAACVVCSMGLDPARVHPARCWQSEGPEWLAELPKDQTWNLCRESTIHLWAGPVDAKSPRAGLAFTWPWDLIRSLCCVRKIFRKLCNKLVLRYPTFAKSLRYQRDQTCYGKAQLVLWHLIHCIISLGYSPNQDICIHRLELFCVGKTLIKCAAHYKNL